MFRAITCTAYTHQKIKTQTLFFIYLSSPPKEEGYVLPLSLR